MYLGTKRVRPGQIRQRKLLRRLLLESLEDRRVLADSSPVWQVESKTGDVSEINLRELIANVSASAEFQIKTASIVNNTGTHPLLFRQTVGSPLIELQRPNPTGMDSYGYIILDQEFASKGAMYVAPGLANNLQLDDGYEIGWQGKLRFEVQVGAQVVPGQLTVQQGYSSQSLDGQANDSLALRIQHRLNYLGFYGDRGSPTPLTGVLDAQTESASDNSRPRSIRPVSTIRSMKCRTSRIRSSILARCSGSCRHLHRKCKSSRSIKLVHTIRAGFINRSCWPEST